MKKGIILICIVSFAGSMVTSCKKAGGNYPGDEYTYDMIHSTAYETYALNTQLPDSIGALLPVAGTVPYTGNPIAGTYDETKGEINLPYTYANTTEDYERAGIELKNPLEQTPQNIAAGKYVFDIYCAICHGAEGDGKGTIVTNGKYTAVPPSYFAEGYINMSDGKMFHSITYGKGAMQNYAYALNKEDRWKVIHYINNLQENYLSKNSITLNNAKDTTKIN